MLALRDVVSGEGRMRKVLVVLGSAAGAALILGASAQAQDEAAFRTQMIARCSTIGEPAARTACIDAANRGPTAPAAAAAPSPAVPMGRSAAAAAAAPMASAGPDSFGREQIREPVREKARRAEHKATGEIEARVVEASDREPGNWTITLESGARWRLLDRDPYFRPPHPNDVVRIKRSSLGGYMMAVDRQALVRVDRVE
jgi:hypothetical protein